MKGILILASLAACVPSSVTVDVRVDGQLVRYFVSERSLDVIKSDLSEYYGDVRVDLECENPRSTAERLTCEDPLLTKANEVRTKAGVYAIENAYGELVDHTSLTLRSTEPVVDPIYMSGCTTQRCLLAETIEVLNDAYGEDNKVPHKILR